MQQFRPLPRFDEMEEAVPVQAPPTATTDPIPTPGDTHTTDPLLTPGGTHTTDPIPTLGVGHITDPLPMPGGPRTPGLIPMPGMAHTTSLGPRPSVTSGHPVVPSSTTSRMPIVLLSGPRPTTDTNQLAALVQKPAGTTKHLTLTSALHASMNTSASATRRLLVIPGDGKRSKRRATSTRRLSPRVRQSVILLITLLIFIIALTSLVPLSDNQNGSFLSSLGNWIRSTQLGGQFAAHQAQLEGQGTQFVAPTYLNGPGLPYMKIANSQYVSVAEQDANNAGIPFAYFVRQIQQESGFNPTAVSPTNAEGIAQFEPGTASGLGINPWDPIQSLRGAAQLMAKYYHQYGNYAKALGAYNAGSGAVQRATQACGANWLSCMPAQSQTYAYRIMGA